MSAVRVLRAVHLAPLLAGVFVAVEPGAALADKPAPAPAVQSSGGAVECKPPTNPEARFYPPSALKRRVAGWAQIRCKVTPEGLLTDCIALDESPKGWCFGAYAVGMAGIMKLTPGSPETRPDTITKTFRFSLPPDR